MSEFRQYRLASQLLDRFSCLRDPKSYSTNLFANDDVIFIIQFLCVFMELIFLELFEF